MITITDTLLIFVTLSGPVIAVQVQKFIERKTESHNRRTWIFQTLMATRAVRAGSFEHVQALNLIEVFYNKNTRNDELVVDSWHVYLDFLSNPLLPGAQESEYASWNDRGVDKLVELLEAMSSSLGFKFDKVRLKRGGYYPQGHANEFNARASIRDGLVRVLSGSQPIPMAVVSLPISENALTRQQEDSRILVENTFGTAATQGGDEAVIDRSRHDAWILRKSRQKSFCWSGRGVDRLLN